MTGFPGLEYHKVLNEMALILNVSVRSTLVRQDGLHTIAPFIHYYLISPLCVQQQFQVHVKITCSIRVPMLTK